MNPKIASANIFVAGSMIFIIEGVAHARANQPHGEIWKQQSDISINDFHDV